MITLIPDHSILNSLAVILASGLAGLLLGLAAERIVLARLRKMAARTKWEWDDIILAGVRGFVPFWGAGIGIYGAIAAAGWSPSLANTVQKALLAVAILSVTLAASRILSGFVATYLRKSAGTEQSLSIFKNVTKLVVFTVGILMMLQQLGVSITPVLTALGVGGLAVALALQDTLGNLFAGVQILASGKIKPGDYVQLDTGQEGYVTDVAWRNTTIRALPNNLIIIPNAKMAAALVTNFYRPEKDLAILVQVGVSYDSDLEQVERVTIEVAQEVMQSIAGGVQDFAPFIRYHTFGDFSINFTVILRGKEYTDQYLIKHEFVKRLHQRYRQEGIEIPFPIRTVHLSGPQ